MELCRRSGRHIEDSGATLTSTPLGLSKISSKPSLCALLRFTTLGFRGVFENLASVFVVFNAAETLEFVTLVEGNDTLRV